MDYKDTLNMMKTDFPMRANLPQREPEILKGWYDDKQYEELMKRNEGKPLFVLHDGPPYANGEIHIGHALNKTLKDNRRMFPAGTLTACPRSSRRARRRISRQRAISPIWSFAASAATRRSAMLISSARASSASAL